MPETPGRLDDPAFLASVTRTLPRLPGGESVRLGDSRAWHRASPHLPRRGAFVLAALLATGHGWTSTDSLGNPEITPALFRHWANSSVSILETYRDYKRTFEEKRRKRYDSASANLADRPHAFLFLAEFNARFPAWSNGNFAAIPTNYGVFNATVQKTYEAFYIGYLVEKSEFGAYGILDEVGLSLGKEDFAGREFLFHGRGGNDAIGFDAGYGILALFWKSGGLDLNLGTLSRTIPRTGFDSTGREVFRFQQESGGRYEGEDYAYELFLDIGVGRYGFNSLYSAKYGLQFFGMEFGLGTGVLSLRPYLRYTRYRGRYQAGAALGKSLGERVTAGAEAAVDAHRNAAGRTRPYFHALVDTREVLFRLPRVRLAEYSGYDYRMVLDQTLSASTDILDALAIGGSAGIACEDVFGILSARLGVGYNEYRHLSAFPIRNLNILDLRLRIAW